MTEPNPKKRRSTSNTGRFENCVKVLAKYACIEKSLFDYANFAFLKISDCNASQNYSFTRAKCNIVEIAENHEVPLLLKFTDVFSKGIQLLTAAENNTRVLDGNEKTAVMLLASYLGDIEQHEKSLRKVISLVAEEKKEEKSLDNHITIALADHLLGKLAPGNSYKIDSHLKTSGKDRCAFDHYKQDSNFGCTGIGNVNAWHGFIDVVSNQGSPDSVGVVVATSDDDEDETDDINSFTNGKEDVIGYEDQAVAQTIVFSFIQRKRHPSLCSLIPNILISSSYFRIIMYDSVHDILLCTAPIPLFATNEKKKLITASVVILWMVLHHRQFCEGIKTNMIVDLDNIKLNFKEQAKDKYDLYLNLSDVGICSFPSMYKKCYPSSDSIYGGRTITQ
ncbi:CHD1 [Mytilus edulis]|uniref:CHD1 n=1 Tax=Mytilus edulis TaxID=6550 RepID=A0A8S3UP42_MYTED|nr:CHD1 [Mytilus edulis]